jgi:6,7-dimethyl-8-ribityllumazine synthase
VVRILTEDTSGGDLSIAVTVSRFNANITERMLAACLAGLAEHGVSTEQTLVVWVPGAFELPYAARRLAESGRYDAVICLGCVIQGETTHNEYINQQVSRAVMENAKETGVPTIFGVITPHNVEQALARAGEGKANKGYEAAVTAIAMGNLRRRLRED